MVPAEDLIAQACLLWKMVYTVVIDFCEHDPGLLLVRHEDLSLKPLEGFQSLYLALGLAFTASAEKEILGSSSSANPGELSASDVHGYKMDSRAGLHSWKRRLSREEIDRVASLTGEVASRHYPDVDWG